MEVGKETGREEQRGVEPEHRETLSWGLISGRGACRALGSREAAALALTVNG